MKPAHGPGAILAILALTLGGAAAAQAQRARPAASARIDQAVFRRLKKLGIEPAARCSDEVFVRRVYLDVCGMLPTARQAWAFASDGGANKRAALVDALLERREFADYQAMRWSDLLRVKSEFPINLWPNAAQAYYQWIWASLRQNLPYDRFARALLTSNGSNFRSPPVNFYRALQQRTPQAIAQAVALTFMGTRADKWPKERLEGMAAFFSRVGYKTTAEWKEEIVFFDAAATASEDGVVVASSAIFPDGKRAVLEPDDDPRKVFADWLIRPGNPWFTRNIANRVWFWLLGRGIIDEPDDLRPDNPPSNPELLAALQKELVASRYDLKRLYRAILHSKVYELSSRRKDQRPEAEANFAHYKLRRLDAEVLVDALCQVTGTTENYSSVIPEPFTFIPPNLRSVNLPDGSITSPTLEMFGRPPRDTGYASERNSRSNPTQRLHLLNSSQVLRKLERGGRIQGVMRAARGDRKRAIRSLYLNILSRTPTTEELGILQGYAGKRGTNLRNALVDTAWALINSAEFQFHH